VTRVCVFVFEFVILMYDFHHIHTIREYFTDYFVATVAQQFAHSIGQRVTVLFQEVLARIDYFAGVMVYRKV
jgi:hypothetical protein